MAPEKAKAHKGLQQKHLHSRISYLYQAATYLSRATGKSQPCTSSFVAEKILGDNQGKAVAMPEAASGQSWPNVPTTLGNVTPTLAEPNVLQSQNAVLSRQLLGHLRAVSLKGQIRLSPNLKHSICKRCDLLLVPGSSATVQMENKSRGGKKPWADVLVMTCTACGTAKRYPVGAKRQLRKEKRPIFPKAETVNTPAIT
jgi:ribonuclease P protein subunit RPR2